MFRLISFESPKHWSVTKRCAKSSQKQRFFEVEIIMKSDYYLINLAFKAWNFVGSVQIAFVFMSALFIRSWQTKRKLQIGSYSRKASILQCSSCKPTYSVMRIKYFFNKGAGHTAKLKKETNAYAAIHRNLLTLSINLKREEAPYSILSHKYVCMYMSFTVCK